MVTIRKLRLYILIVIPSIFLLRKYIAIFRSRALIHYYCPDGLERGYAKVYSYETKRKLYIRGIKEFDQDCVKPDFIIRATDTMGFFFDENEYQIKKNEAIKKITTRGEKKDEKTNKTIEKFRDGYFLLMKTFHKYLKKENTKRPIREICEIINDNGFEVNPNTMNFALREAEKINEKKEKELLEKARINEEIIKAKAALILKEEKTKK